MVEFLKSYGIVIAFGLLLLLMMRGHGRGGTGCGMGGHRHLEQGEKPQGERSSEGNQSRPGCH